MRLYLESFCLPLRSGFEDTSDSSCQQRTCKCNDSSGCLCCRFSAFIPIKMEIHDFGLYNCVLDRPVRIVPLREDSVFVPIQHMLVSGSIYGAPHNWLPKSALPRAPYQLSG
jgi:hypothetical protein